jgi:hypothetical protein
MRKQTVEDRGGERYLSANANLAGRMGMSGAVAKATKKQTAAPSKHAPKPINLDEGDIILMQCGENGGLNTCLSHLERAK